MTIYTHTYIYYIFIIRDSVESAEKRKKSAQSGPNYNRSPDWSVLVRKRAVSRLSAESWSVVNVNRSELGSVDNIAEWGSSRFKRAEKVQSRASGWKKEGEKNGKKNERETTTERGRMVKTGGKKRQDRGSLFLSLNGRRWRRGRRWSRGKE